MKEAIVASPGELMAALRHHLICEALAWDCVDSLVESLLDVGVERALQSLERSMDREFVTVDDLGLLNARHLRSAFDADKTLDLIVLVDDLSNYDTTSVFGVWDSAPTLSAVEASYTHSDLDLERSLRVVAHQQCGRDAFFGVPTADAEGPRLILSLDDIECMLMTSGTNELSLWYFARAVERLSRTTDVISFSAFDTWSVYVEQDWSFYLGDGVRPDLLQISPAQGQLLRQRNTGGTISAA